MDHRLRDINERWYSIRASLAENLIDITQTEIKVTRWSDPIILDWVIVDQKDKSIQTILINLNQVK